MMERQAQKVAINSTAKTGAEVKGNSSACRLYPLDRPALAENRLDVGGQFGFSNGAGMIVPHNAGAIDQNKRRRGAGAVGLEIAGADRIGKFAERCVILVPDLLDILLFRGRRSRIAAGRISIEARGTDQCQALRSELFFHG